MKWYTQAVAALTRFGKQDGPGAGKACYPLVGAGCGCVLALIMALAVLAVGVKAGAVLGALAVFAGELWLTGARRYGGLIRFLEREFDGTSDAVGAYVRISVFQGFLILKLLCYATLAFSGHAAWLIVAFCLAGMVAAECGAGTSPSSGAGTVDDGDWQWAWVTGVALAGAAGWLGGLLVTSLVAALATWLAPLACARLLRRRNPSGEGWSAPMEEVLLQAVLLLGAATAMVL